MQLTAAAAVVVKCDEHDTHMQSVIIVSPYVYHPPSSFFASSDCVHGSNYIINFQLIEYVIKEHWVSFVWPKYGKHSPMCISVVDSCFESQP
jgi:hypothetical protein